MTAVRVPDVLVRVSPKMLEKYQSLCVAGAGRGRAVPLPFTFARADASTCATHWDRDSILRLAAANMPRIEWVDLDGDGVRETPGLLLEGSRINIVLHNRDLTNAAWTKTNVTAVKDQTGIDGVASSASKITATSANGTCLQAITTGSTQRAQFAYVKRITGSGTINMTMDNGSTWTVVTVTAAWTKVTIPPQTLANPTVGFRIVTSGDAIAVDYVQNEAGAFESSPLATTTGAVTRAADSLTLPFNFGPMDLTVLARVARPVWVGVTDTATHQVWALAGTATGSARLQGQDTGGSWAGVLAGSPNSSTVFPAIPAGAELKACTQLSGITSGGIYKLDTGSGFTSGSAASPFSAWASQTLHVGQVSGILNFYGVILDVMFMRGLYTLNEALAAP